MKLFSITVEIYFGGPLILDIALDKATSSPSTSEILYETMNVFDTYVLKILLWCVIRSFPIYDLRVNIFGILQSIGK
ncbi:hypothetical protein Anas_13585 [Armadillidium nasatum]|uniref:Uncharacterized protein n=1 Tax=Armadillidium nasatum TaxID=96803 RepID=A0A5N5T3V7_9CRUS|nr:hypothetical protein Anas_13585 [Armadillidium nasatum]